MKNKGIIAIFTLLALVLSVSAVWLFSNPKSPIKTSSVLGTATENDLKVESNIEYIKSNSDGSSEIKYAYTFSNISSLYYIISIRAQTSLQNTFSPHPFQILSHTSDGLIINPSFNGTSNTQLLSDGYLNIGEVKHIYLVVKFYPEGSTGPFQNRITSTGDIILPPTGSTSGGSDGGSTGSSTGGGSTTSTPPSTSTTTTTTGGTTSPGTTSTTGGTTVGNNPPTPPVSNPGTSTTGGSSTGGTGSTNGGSTTTGTTGGSTGGTTGDSTGGGDPDTVAAAQVSFTLTASGGGGTITQLPNTSILPFHFGIISNIKEWIKDNFLKEERNKIKINKIDVNGEIFSGDETSLNLGFWILPESSKPGEGGNTIIAGHRFTYNYGPYTFYNLDKLSHGDSIDIIWEGKTYTYKVTNIKQVEATDLSVLKQKPNRLTLITCTNWNSNDPRLVIQAELQ